MTQEIAGNGAHHQAAADEAARSENTRPQAAERTADAWYLRWVQAQEQGQRAGNPPDSRLLSARIAELAREFPEYSALDIEQAEIDADARRYWNSSAYPPYVGPGYTEPPLNWAGWNRPRSDYEKDHHWDNFGRDWPDRNFPAHAHDIPVRDEFFALPANDKSARANDLQAGPPLCSSVTR